jgi:hypothetical protein
LIAFGRDDLICRVLGRIELQTERVVLIVVSLRVDYAGAALLLSNTPKLEVAVTAVDSTDVVSAAITAESAFPLPASTAGVVWAVILEDVGFAPR